MDVSQGELFQSEGYVLRSDEELMMATAAGKIDAYEQLVERHQATARGVAYRLLKDADKAEEVAQEAFLKIFEAAERYEPTATFKTYLCRVVSRLCYDLTAKNKPVSLDPFAGPEQENMRGTPEDKLLRREQNKQVRRALETLPERQKIAVTLKYSADLKYREIAEAMETTEKAVERLLARGKRRLKKLLVEQDQLSIHPEEL